MGIFWHIGFRAVFAAAIAGTAAWWYASSLPDVYRATALLLLDVRPFESQERTTRAADMIAPDSGLPAAFLRPMLPPPPAMPDIAAILLCDEVAATTFDALVTTRPDLVREAALSSRTRVHNALSVKPRVLLQTPREIFYQHTLELHATVSHPEAAAELANAWVGAGMDAVHRSLREGSDRYVQFLQARLRETRASYTDILERMAALQSQGGMDAINEKRSSLKKAVFLTEHDIQSLQDRNLPFFSPNQPAHDEATKESLMAESLADKQNVLADQRRRLEELEVRLEQLRRELPELESRKEAHESLVKALTIKLEEVRLAAGDPSPVFKIVSRAHVPESPAGPNRRLLIVSAAFFGLALGTAHFFVMRALRHYAPLLAGDTA